MLKPGAEAPDFAVGGQTLHGLLERGPVVVFFFPKAASRPLCLMAVSHLPPIVMQLQRETRCFTHVTCPDCLGRLELENRVVFLLGHADTWELCQAMSAYERLCGECEEPELARQLKEQALRHQSQGEYSQALHKTTAALEALKQAILKEEV